MNTNSSSSPSDKSSSAVEIRLQFRCKRDRQLSLVLEYLNCYDYVLSDVVKELLKTRFLPAALDDEGKLNRTVALECIGRLKGYIYEIEQLAGIESSAANPESRVSTSLNHAVDYDGEKQEVGSSDLRQSPPANLNAIDRMLGVAPSRPAS